MAGPSRQSAEDIASYCVGDKPPGTHLDDFFERVEEEERLEVDSDDVQSLGHDSDSEEENRVESLLAGAYNLHSIAASSIMPAERTLYFFLIQM